MARPTCEVPLETGDAPLRFEPGVRYFVVVAAVFDGWCGVLDTERGELEPLACDLTLNARDERSQ